MKDHVLKPMVRHRPLRLAIPLLILLGCAAIYVWSTPRRIQQALERASLSELQADIRLHPENNHAYYYLGQRFQQEGRLPEAYDAFSHASQQDMDDEKSWLATAALASQLYGDHGAFDLLGIYLKKHPNSAQAHLAFSRLYHKNLSHKRAQEEALAAAQLDPHLGEAWYLAGRSANSMGAVSDAEVMLRRAVAEAPQEWRYAMILSSILASEKRDQEALGFAMQAAKQAPQEGVTTLALGKLQLEMAISTTELERARQTLSHSAVLQPDIPITHLLIGRIYIRQSLWREAKMEMESAARLTPLDPAPIYDLVFISRKLGDSPGADRYSKRHVRLQEYAQQKLTIKEKIVTLKNEAPDLRLKLARLSEENEDNQEAIEQYRRYLDTNPGAAEVKSKLARLESISNHGAEAANSMPAYALSESESSSLSELLHQADVFYARRQYVAAEQTYIRVLTQDKQSALGCQGLGLTLVAEGKNEKALNFLLNAVKLNPKLAPAQFALAQAYMSINAPAETRRRMLRVVEIDPSNAAYWHLLGIACGGADAYHSQSEEALRRAVKLEPTNVAYWLDLADQVAQDNRSEDAVAIYRQALVLAPSNSDTMVRFGMFLAKTTPTPGRQEEAEKLLRTVLDSNPDDSYALYAMGQLCLNLGEGKQAVNYLQKAISHSTQIDNAELWYLLARAYRRIGDNKKADTAQEASKRLREEYEDMQHSAEQLNKKPKDVALRLKLARIYAKRGENAKSLNMYNICLQIAPGNSQARAELASLENRLKSKGMLPQTIAFRSLIDAAGQ